MEINKTGMNKTGMNKTGKLLAALLTLCFFVFGFFGHACAVNHRFIETEDGEDVFTAEVILLDIDQDEYGFFALHVILPDEGELWVDANPFMYFIDSEDNYLTKEGFLETYRDGTISILFLYIEGQILVVEAHGL